MLETCNDLMWSPPSRSPCFVWGQRRDSLCQALGAECKAQTREKVWGRADLMAGLCGTQGSIRLVSALKQSCRFEGCALGARLPGS